MKEQLIKLFTLDPSNPRMFVGQLIGYIPLAIAFVTFILTKRKHIIVSKTASDLLCGLHFFLIGDLTGGAICMVNTVRGIFFYHRGRKPWTSHILVPILFIIFTFSTSFIGWRGAISLLPTFGSILAIIGLWCNNPLLLKLFNLPAVTMWLIYSIVIESPSTTLINVLSIITIIISFARLLITNIMKKGHKDCEGKPTDCTDTKDE